jgi:DNA integrity scanning protein DisA with diadenylate cyclase activity
MICMSEEQGIIRVAFSGDLNRNNILSIRENILGALS